MTYCSSQLSHLFQMLAGHIRSMENLGCSCVPLPHHSLGSVEGGLREGYRVAEAEVGEGPRGETK